MASALQCPACGHKHRLTGLSGDPVFACEQCGRLLKTPVEYRRPDPSAPTEAPRPNGSSRSRRERSASREPARARPVPRAAPAAPAPRAAAIGPSATRRRGPRPPATIAVPLQILGWVVAVLLGGIVVRYLARWTGLLTGDSIIDIITGSGWGRYLRLFAVVPFWALASAGLMTGFVEGGRWWAARRRGVEVGRPGTGAKRRPVPSAVPEPRPTPTPAQATRRPPSEAEPTPSTTPAAETRSPSAAAAAPRVRRIPKRDISSLGDGS